MPRKLCELPHNSFYHPSSYICPCMESSIYPHIHPTHPSSFYLPINSLTPSTHTRPQTQGQDRSKGSGHAPQVRPGEGDRPVPSTHHPPPTTFPIGKPAPGSAASLPQWLLPEEQGSGGRHYGHGVGYTAPPGHAGRRRTESQHRDQHPLLL